MLVWMSFTFCSQNDTSFWRRQFRECSRSFSEIRFLVRSSTLYRLLFSSSRSWSCFSTSFFSRLAMFRSPYMLRILLSSSASVHFLWSICPLNADISFCYSLTCSPSFWIALTFSSHWVAIKAVLSVCLFSSKLALCSNSYLSDFSLSSSTLLS